MTRVRRMPMMLAGLAGVLLLGGCATDGYGYGGMSMGGGYYDGYDPYYGGPGYYGYGAPYYSGWYNDYYYPGGGYYVYDRRGARHRWSPEQRAYWERRRQERREDANRGDGVPRGGDWYRGRTPGSADPARSGQSAQGAAPRQAGPARQGWRDSQAQGRRSSGDQARSRPAPSSNGGGERRNSWRRR